jgi:outer membrane autotransporter protein
MPDGSDCAVDWASSMAFWTAGSLQFGSMTPSGLSSGNRFATAGLTAGVDLRLDDNVIVGAALGYGADRSDVGQNGSRSDGASFNGALYASMRLFDPVFIDATVGYGSLGYDNRRWVSGDGTVVDGTRKGSYWFGALEASLEMRRDEFKFAPYARMNYMAATLDGYAEQGASAELLTFNAMKFHAVSGAIGLRGSIDIPTSFGRLTPMARLEYKQTSQSAYDQSMYYTDLGAGMSSTFSQPAGSYGMTTGAIGLRARGAGGFAVEMEYGVTGGTGSLFAQSIRGAVRLPF